MSLQEPVAAGGGASNRASLFEGGLIVAGFLIVFLVVGHQVIGDGIYRFRDIQNLLYDGHLTYSHFSLVMPLASVPFLLLGHVVESQEWWAGRFNVIVVAAGALAAWRLLRGRGDPVLLRRTLLMLLAASLLSNQLRDYNAEVFSATLITLGILCIVTDQHTLLGWAGIVIAVVNTPALIVGVAALVAVEIIRTRQLRAAGAIVAAVALALLENRIRHAGRHHLHERPWVSDAAALLGSPWIQLSVRARPRVDSLLVRPRPPLLHSRALPLARRHDAARGRRLPSPDRPTGVRRRGPRRRIREVVGVVWRPGLGTALFHPRRGSGGADRGSSGARCWAVGRPRRTCARRAGALRLGRLRRPRPSLDPPAVCSANHYALESFCWDVPEFSSLWLPVLHPPPLTAATVTISAWCIIVFAYFAAPLVVALARRARVLSPVRS